VPSKKKQPAVRPEDLRKIKLKDAPAKRSHKKKPSPPAAMTVTSETPGPEIAESFLEDVSETMPRIADDATPADVDAPSPDPLANDEDVCECHHRRACHRAGKDDCLGSGLRAEEVCDSGCLAFRLDLDLAVYESGARDRSGEDAALETPKPPPVAVDDKDLLPRVADDLDISGLTRVKHTITTHLDTEARARVGGLLADLVQEKAAYIEQAKETRKTLKRGEDELQAELDKAAREYHEGVSTTEVEAFEWPNIEGLRVEVYRLDNREFIKSRPFNGGERESALASRLKQTELFEKEEKPIAAETMAPAPAKQTSADVCAECGHQRINHPIPKRNKNKMYGGCLAAACLCRAFLEPTVEPSPEEVAEFDASPALEDDGLGEAEAEE